MIPKPIYQTAKFPNRLPAEIVEAVGILKGLNPGWSHRIFSDKEQERFIKSEYGERELRLFRSIDPDYGAARADLFRYLLIYKYGGVYLDVKSTATLSFDSILCDDDAFILAQWPNSPGSKYEGWGLHDALAGIEGGEYVQWMIIAESGHPFLRRVIDNVLYKLENYDPVIHGVGRQGVLALTGPIADCIYHFNFLASCGLA